MNKTRYIKIFILLGVLTLVFSGNKAIALTISPARIELRVDPGQTITGEFTLTNEQDDTKTFYSSVANFEARGETGTPTFTDSTEGLASWVKLIPKVELAKGQVQRVDFSVTVPENAAAGGYFSAIFLSTSPNGTSSSQVSIGAKIGVLLLLRVTGDVREGGGIVGFQTAGSSTVFSSLPINFVYHFNNTGSDRVNPIGSLVVNNIFGGEAFRVSANPEQGNVLPGSTRKFMVAWSKDADRANNPPPVSGFFATAGYQWQNFALGKYTAHLALSYGEKGTTAESELTVYVIPWQLLIILFVAAVIFLFIFTIAIKRYNNWIISMASRTKRKK